MEKENKKNAINENLQTKKKKLRKIRKEIETRTIKETK